MAGAVLAPACTPSAPKRPTVPSTDFGELLQRYPQANLEAGRAVYLRQCVTCHQADGQGTGNAIPPLAGHVTKLAAHPQGRSYLARLGLYGLTGRIEVDGRQFFNVMPTLGPLLRDEDVAGALNYALTQWGNDANLDAGLLLRPEDVAAERATRRRGADNLKLRRQLWPEITPP